MLEIWEEPGLDCIKGGLESPRPGSAVPGLSRCYAQSSCYWPTGCCLTAREDLPQSWANPPTPQC